MGVSYKELLYYTIMDCIYVILTLKKLVII